MTPEQLRSLVRVGPVLADGGTGSALVALGVPADACLDVMTVSDPELVRSVHQGFVRAGSRLVMTNTFGANRYALARRGASESVAAINRAAVALAREAGAEIVAGSVGPLGVRLAPYGRVRAAAARAAYAEQIAELASAGADLVWIETQSDLVELEQALAAARDVCDLAVIASATFTRDDRTLLGSSAAQVAARLHELGLDAIGANCSEGPGQVLRLVRQMAEAAPGAVLVAKPNAGGPQRIGMRIIWPATPAYFAERGAELVELGVRIVGGCCGTNAEHVRALAGVLEPGVRSVGATTAVRAVEREQKEASVGTDVIRTRLGRMLDDREFVIAVEIDPPPGLQTARMVAGAQTLSEAGAHVACVTGSSRARIRMSPWAPCRLIQEEAGLECVLTFPTRGRSLLRIQGDLLGAHALGIRNVFVCQGDPASIGERPTAASDTDVVPSGVIGLIAASLNRGTDESGERLGQQTGFVVGCALNPNAPDPDAECRVLRRKVRAGADFAFTQPLWESGSLREITRRYEQRYGPLNLSIIAGVLPVVTPRHAEFLNNEVAGMDVPESVRERMRRAAEPETEGLAMALDAAVSLREIAAGVYLMTPFARFDLVSELIDGLQRA
jgi:homocysteine S-methyltransferase